MWLNMGDHDFFMWYYLGWYETVLNIDMRKNNTFLCISIFKMLYDWVLLKFFNWSAEFWLFIYIIYSFLIHLFLF